MSLGVGGGYSSQSTQQQGMTTTPWTQLLPGLAPTLTGGLQNIAGGGSTAQGMQAITNLSKQDLTTGIQGMKSAFAGSGMAQSTDLMRGISTMTQQAQTGLTAQLAQFYQQGIQDQLAALAAIISMASGSSQFVQTGHQSGWDISAAAGTKA
jgi:hypothetical protein